jgi:hypothetical protein
LKGETARYHAEPGGEMKNILAAILLIVAAPTFAQVHVNGYTKKDGTYVQPHERTAPNSTNMDNYSTKGNVNPYTGQLGTKEPDGYGYQGGQHRQGTQPSQLNTGTQQPSSLQPLKIEPIKPLKF